MRTAVLLAALMLSAAPAAFAQDGTAGDDGARAAALLRHLADAPAPTVVGNPQGRITIVEFFDYRCPYCRQMQATLGDLLAGDHRVRVVLKEWPIFGGVSVYAAKVAIAAGWQGRFADMHDALWTVHAPMTEAAIRAAARTAGVDVARLDRDLVLHAAEIDRMLAENRAQAGALRLSGTPGLVVGRYVVRGAVSLHDLRGIIDDAERASAE
jgi:protein-disulfide isomerase